MADQPALGPCRGEHHRGRLHKFGVRPEVDAEGAVQLGLFKAESIRWQKVKSPAEVVAGIMRLVGDFQFPRPGLQAIGEEPGYQGQEIMNPPSVEGWHTGAEWIDSGSLVRRINLRGGPAVQR